jgi:hypothetical protein
MVVILALKFAALGRAKVDAMGRAGRGRQGRNIPTPAISFQPKPGMAHSITERVTVTRRRGEAANGGRRNATHMSGDLCA